MDSGDKLHVVVFPWLAFGHVIPYFELSKRIAQKGHKVSFVSTNKIIDRLPQMSSNLSSNIDLVGFPLPDVEHLPVGAGSTMDIKGSETMYLFNGFNGLEPELTRFLEKSNPDWIIYDFASHWLPPIAGKLGISRAYFATINSWSSVFFVGPSLKAMIEGLDPRKNVEDFTVPPEWVPFPTTLAYRSYETKWIARLIQTDVSGINGLRRGALTLSGSDVYLVRDCFEFKPEWLKLLENLHSKPVIPVGLMPPTVQVSAENVPVLDEWLKCQSKSSILYVALGSEVVLSQQELTELALGLELSGLPFLWALKKPSSESDVIELPEGFVERVRNRGLVWTGWAPQVKILSHDSVGGFLTHCGSGSCIEGITFGKPLIMLPISADQGLNARIYAEEKVGAEIPRNEDGSFTRKYVSDSVKLVMVQDEGYRMRATELSRIFGDNDLHDRYIDNLVQYMKTCKKRSARS